MRAFGNRPSAGVAQTPQGPPRGPAGTAKTSLLDIPATTSDTFDVV